MGTSQDCPTILIAVEDAELRDSLALRLRQNDYLVLEAANSASALSIARTYFRVIHLALIGTNLDHGVLASALRQYRPKSSIFFITEIDKDRLLHVLAMEDVLANVRAFFQTVADCTRTAA